MPNRSNGKSLTATWLKPVGAPSTNGLSLSQAKARMNKILRMANRKMPAEQAMDLALEYLELEAATTEMAEDLPG